MPYQIVPDWPSVQNPLTLWCTGSWEHIRALAHRLMEHQREALNSTCSPDHTPATLALTIDRTWYPLCQQLGTIANVQTSSSPGALDAATAARMGLRRMRTTDLDYAPARPAVAFDSMLLPPVPAAASVTGAGVTDAAVSPAGDTAGVYVIIDTPDGRVSGVLASQGRALLYTYAGARTLLSYFQATPADVETLAGYGLEVQAVTSPIAAVHAYPVFGISRPVRDQQGDRVVTYTLSSGHTRTDVAREFLGKLTRWDDPSEVAIVLASYALDEGLTGLPSDNCGPIYAWTVCSEAVAQERSDRTLIDSLNDWFSQNTAARPSHDM